MKYDFEHVFLEPPVLWHVGKMCSAANVIYSNSHLRMCGYGVSLGKVRIMSASTPALYHFEHPHIRILPVATRFQQLRYCTDTVLTCAIIKTMTMPAIRQRTYKPSLQSNIHRPNTGEITRYKTLQCERKTPENNRKISPKPSVSATTSLIY